MIQMITIFAMSAIKCICYFGGGVIFFCLIISFTAMCVIFSPQLSSILFSNFLLISFCIFNMFAFGWVVSITIILFTTSLLYSECGFSIWFISSLARSGCLDLSIVKPRDALARNCVAIKVFLLDIVDRMIHYIVYKTSSIFITGFSFSHRFPV